MKGTLPPIRVTLAMLAVLLMTPAVQAGDDPLSINFGGNAFFPSSPCPAKRVPTFEAVVPVPSFESFVNPFEEGDFRIFCQVNTLRKGKGAKKVKGNWQAELVILDNVTGDVDRVFVQSGFFTTKKTGTDDFDFDLPDELFADGFESGDVSAWSYTRTNFTNQKRVDSARLTCDTVAGGGTE